MINDVGFVSLQRFPFLVVLVEWGYGNIAGNIARPSKTALFLIGSVLISLSKG